ncbi:MAG: hypothetical protein RI958_2234 [Actinomycetota bacterium]|jgi:hypothetical protein
MMNGITIARRLLLTVSALAVVGTALGLVFVDRTAVTYRDGLEVARDSAAVVATVTDSVEVLAADVADLAGAAADTLDQAGVLIESGSESAEQIGIALGTNLAEGVEGTANIASGLAGFIEAIERFIPGDSRSLGEDLRAIATGLEPVPGQLRSLGDQLISTSVELEASKEQLAVVAGELDALTVGLEGAAASLAEVDRLAASIEASAEDALDRSRADLWVLRILVLVLGLGTIAACLAAWYAVGVLARQQDAQAGRGAGGGT